MSMEVDIADCPVLGRQTAVKNAGLRSVRSACGTTWSEVADFAEQDTRISSGGTVNSWFFAAHGKNSKIYINYNRLYMEYIYLSKHLLDIYDIILHIYL